MTSSGLRVRLRATCGPAQRIGVAPAPDGACPRPETFGLRRVAGDAALRAGTVARPVTRRFIVAGDVKRQRQHLRARCNYSQLARAIWLPAAVAHAPEMQPAPNRQGGLANGGDDAYARDATTDNRRGRFGYRPWRRIRARCNRAAAPLAGAGRLRPHPAQTAASSRSAASALFLAHACAAKAGTQRKCPHRHVPIPCPGSGGSRTRAKQGQDCASFNSERRVEVTGAPGRCGGPAPPAVISCCGHPCARPGERGR